MIKAFVRWILFLFSRTSTIPEAQLAGPYRSPAVVDGSVFVDADARADAEADVWPREEKLKEHLDALDQFGEFSSSTEFRTIHDGQEIPDKDLITRAGDILSWAEVEGGWMVYPNSPYHAFPIVVATESNNYVYVYWEKQEKRWLAETLRDKDAAYRLGASGNTIPDGLRKKLKTL
ncbi:MAG: hypothetical protein DRQ40_04495 [Gammaproteobacteria bacterium]|nr:MAG: hypothetical protein DRQ40_04495 [Gammaproteobacteria bacterium]